MANETYCAAESANGTETHEEEHYTAHYAVLAVTFVVFWGILVRNIWNIPAIKKYVPLPYTVVMLIVGLIWGLIYEATGEETGDLGDLSIAFSYLVKIHPDIILYVFIPALVFESSYAINHHTFRVVFANAFLVASVGVVIVIGLTSTFCFYAFTKYEWDWLTALLLSSILAATDPVAVVALLRELGVSERLSTLIEGESLLNDGSAFVCFLLFLDQLTACPGEERNAGEFATFTLQLAVGGPLMGIAFAIMTIILLDLTFFDDIIEVSITIIAPYLCFWTCEYVEVSSVLGVVFLGLFVGRFGKAMLSSLESEEYIHRVWELISWWANTLLFVITGMVLSDRVFFNSGGVLDATDVGYLFALYAVLHVVRFISIAVLMPVLRLSGYGLNWGEVTVMTYGGLRGAIGLALALIVEDTAQVNEADRTRIMFLVGGIVGLTLLVNGSTTQFLLKVFHMGEITPERYQILDNIIDHTQEVVYESINNLQADPFFQGSDWVKVNDNLDLDNFFIERDVQADSYEEVAIDATVPMASTADGEADIEAAQHLPPASESDAGVTPMASEKQRKELRMLFLSSLKAIFTRYFYEERILNTYAYNSLMDALNREGDLDTDSLADLWEKTKGNVRQPDFLRKLRNVPGLGWAAQRATYYYISTYLQRCIAFIQAMREVRIVLEHAEGHVADPLRDEIEEITRDAHTDLVAITGWAPEAITSLQTQHSTFHILKMLLHEITEGLEEGILESSEFEAYRQLIYKRIKDLKRQRIYAPDASTDKEILEAFGGLQCFAEAYYKLNLNHHKVFIDVGESLSLKSKDKSIFIILRGVCRWTQLEYEGAPELGEITEKDEKKAAQGFEKILPSIMKNKDTDGEVIKEEEADKSSVSSPNISPPSAEHSPDMQASRNEQSAQEVVTTESNPEEISESNDFTLKVENKFLDAKGPDMEAMGFGTEESRVSRNTLASKKSDHRFRWEIEGRKGEDEESGAGNEEDGDGVFERRVFGGAGAVVGDVGTLTHRGDMKEVEAISLVEAIQLNRDMLKEIFTNPEFHDCEVAIWRSVATKTVNHHLRRALQDVIDVEEVRECINVSNIIKGSAANVNEIFPMNCGSENVLLLRGHATIRVVPDAEEDSDEEDDPRRNIIESGGVEAVGAGLHKVVAPNMIFEHTMIAFISADAILMPLEATEKNTVKHRLLRMATHDMRARPTITAEKRASVAGRKSLARSRTQMGYAARASEPFFPGGGGQSSAELRPRHSVATGSRPSMHARASMNSTRESASKTPGGGPSLVRMRSQSSGAHGKGKKRNQLGPRTSLSTPNGPNVVRRQVTFTPETAEDKTNAKSPDE